MDTAETAELEVRVKPAESAESAEPIELVEPAEASELSGTSDPSVSTDSAEPLEPPESSKSSEQSVSAEPADAKAAKEARISAAKQETMDNMKELARLAEKISKMRRSPSPPNPTPLRKKKSNKELLRELIARRMESREQGRDDLFDPEDGESSLGFEREINAGNDKGKGKGKGKANQEFEFEYICNGGDVLLAVGDTLFQVYSQCLVCASPIFEDMLEDIDRRPGNQERILWLTTENAEIVRTICFIIHLSSELVPLTLSPPRILETAVMVEKYGLQAAVKFVSRQWLLNGRDAREFLVDPTMAYGCYVAAAVLFDDEDMFEKCIQDLVTICTVPFERLWIWPPLKEQLPHKAIKLLTILRDKARAKVSQILLGETGLGCYRSWSKVHQERYEGILARYKPTTTVRFPLAQVVTEAKRALSRELGGPDAPAACLLNLAEGMDEVVRTAGIGLVKYRKIMLKEGDVGLEDVACDDGSDSSPRKRSPPASRSPPGDRLPAKRRSPPDHAS